MDAGEPGDQRLSAAIPGRPPPSGSRPALIGVLSGEGVGPEVVDAALGVLDAAAGACDLELEIAQGPGAALAVIDGSSVSQDAITFCRDIFAAGGAVLTGPHGGRWVYELRRRLDLFCKLSPLQPGGYPERSGATDVLVVREQAAGVYQGTWAERDDREGGRVAEHAFSYGEDEVARIVAVGVELARQRDGRLAVIVKDGGVPAISRLWRGVAREAVPREIALEFVDIDYAVYRLISDPASFDVVVAPNLFGDILSDAGGLLLGSRGLCFGASFDSGDAAVYQTNHGAAHDLAGRGTANPGAQIRATAMMLRESFARPDAAALIERALAATWQDGFRTAELVDPGARSIGTAELAEAVSERMAMAATLR